MENKTAVEQLIDLFYKVPIDEFRYLFEPALELEKQQIINAANIQKEQRWYEDKYNSCGEKYYSETYNKPT